VIPTDEADCTKVGEISRKWRTMRSLFLEGILWDMANREREDTVRDAGAGLLAGKRPS